jgi:citrate lyase subunit beta/citryl-CoA lyase
VPRSAQEVLFAGEARPALLPVCDHYAGSLRYVDKALELQQRLGPLFDLSCDLEDGAPDTGIDAALELAAAFAGVIADPQRNRHGRIGVRVHPVADARCTHEIELLLARCGARLAYVTLPKAQGADDVRHALELLRATSRALGLARTPPLHVLIETHGALAEVQAIAALRGVECLSFGLMDFVSAHHGAIGAEAMRSPGQFEHGLVRRAKLEIAAACHAHGKVPSHNVCVELNEPQRAGSDAARARAEFGYTRMWSIHPLQIEPIVAALTPQAAEVELAERIVAAARAADWAPVAVDGRLHDRASYRYYWQLLERAGMAARAEAD